MTDGAAPTPAQAAALLDWYVAMGVDVALADGGQDRFAAAPQAASGPVREPTPAPAAKPASAARPVPAAFSTTADAAVMAAREAAGSAETLEALRAIVDGFEGCGLKVTASRLVFADGDPAAKIMLVGEAPGREEDLDGRPFVGRSGQLLDRMLAAIGLDRTGVYIANVLPWRPPGNRTPTPQETEICLPFIRRQIELADPDLLVLLGGAAVQSVLGRTEGILKLRGQFFPYDTGRRPIRATATLHPAYLLRSPLQKRLAWRDMRAIRRAVQDAGAV